PQHLDGGADVAPERLVLLQFGADFLQRLHDHAEVDAVGHADVEHSVAEVAGHVHDGADGAEGNRVDGAGVVAHPDAADAHRFDDAGMAAEIDDVADRDGVLGEDEDAGDDVLHQGLGAEADGEADDAGTGQKRRDIEAELREHDQRHHDDEHDAEGVAQERQQRAHARVGGGVAPARPVAPEEALDQLVHQLGQHERHQQDDADGDQSAEDAAAEVAGQPVERVQAPDLQQRQHDEEIDDALQQGLQERQIAVGAGLES